jgi:hypothetical protein
MHQSSSCAINWCYAKRQCHKPIQLKDKPIQLQDKPIQLKDEGAEVNTTKKWGSGSKLEKRK